MTRETVAVETPAIRATSYTVVIEAVRWGFETAYIAI
jgi:hypothetical protein